MPEQPAPVASSSGIVASSKRKARRQTYVALLRGINLGSRNKVSMADLRTLVVTIGGEDVVTYVQSGNVVFKSDSDSTELIRALEDAISRELGLTVTVLLRTKQQVNSILGANPFAGGREPRALHVTFLADTPEPARVRELEKRSFDPDEFRVDGAHVYLSCPKGYGRTKLNNAFFEKHLGVAATTRNWNTVTKLVELASG
jgi:uncharacterized protein (DUF1697 family)